MKKIVLVLALIALISAGAFAIDMSAGGGAVFDWSFNNGREGKDGKWTDYTGIRNLSFGGFVFIDIAYVELNVSFSYGSITYVYDYEDITSGTDPLGNMLQFGFGAIFKYPIVMGQMVIFPFAGFDYNLVVSRKAENGTKFDNPGDFNQFGLLAGIGFDNYFSSNMYFRVEAAIHLRFASQWYKDWADIWKYYYDSADTTLGLGPRIIIAIGSHF